MMKVQMIAERMVDGLVPMIGAVERRDRPLADQLRRAAQSVVLNIAEAQGVEDGNRRLHFQRAAGSNHEVRAALRMAARWGYVEPRAAEVTEGLADQVQAILWRLTH